MADIVLEIRGMTCGHCVAAVTAALKAVPGVTGVAVTLDSGRAEIAGAKAKLTDVLQAVAGKGFTPIVSK
jgi:copper chaperone